MRLEDPTKDERVPNAGQVDRACGEEERLATRGAGQLRERSRRTVGRERAATSDLPPRRSAPGLGECDPAFLNSLAGDKHPGEEDLRAELEGQGRPLASVEPAPPTLRVSGGYPRPLTRALKENIWIAGRLWSVVVVQITVDNSIEEL